MGNLIKRECPACGVTYDADAVRLGYGRQTTCSRACSYVLRGRQKERGQAVRCAVCDIEFTRSASQIKSKHGAMYCTPACMYRGRTLGLTPRIVTDDYVRVAPVNMDAIRRTVATRKLRDNYRHSDDTRARLSEATTRAIAEGRIKAVSGLEDEVAAELDRLGIDYRRQVPIRGDRGRFIASADFMLSDGRAVEVNGTFWHADPRVYPDGPVYPSQVRSAEAWARKIAALDRLGIVLVVLWEQDLRDNLSEAIASALLA